ncbi:BtrH N-terminal domain-containing protein [Kitasatospora arboriphila]
MTTDHPPRVHHITGAPPEFWYRDLASCLQATFGSVLLRADHDPLEVLGTAWQFLYRPGEVRSEEFYFPTRYEGDLGRGIAPHHPLTSVWRTPDDPADPLAGLRAALDADRLVIAAVDNHHLPFRPAYHDVHAAHLVTVFGLDEHRGLVHVADATPAAFRGAVPLDAFLAAWDSANPSDVQDAFFSDSRIGGAGWTSGSAARTRRRRPPGSPRCCAPTPNCSPPARPTGRTAPRASPASPGSPRSSSTGPGPATRRRSATSTRSAGACRRRPRCTANCSAASAPPGGCPSWPGRAAPWRASRTPGRACG